MFVLVDVQAVRPQNFAKDPTLQILSFVSFFSHLGRSSFWGLSFHLAWSWFSFFTLSVSFLDFTVSLLPPAVCVYLDLSV